MMILPVIEKEGDGLAADKKVQNLAKNLVQLIGKMDAQVGENERRHTQEASNKAFREELSKKTEKNINI